MCPCLPLASWAIDIHWPNKGGTDASITFSVECSKHLVNALHCTTIVLLAVLHKGPSESHIHLPRHCPDNTCDNTVWCWALGNAAMFVAFNDTQLNQEKRRVAGFFKVAAVAFMGMPTYDTVSAKSILFFCWLPSSGRYPSVFRIQQWVCYNQNPFITTLLVYINILGIWLGLSPGHYLESKGKLKKKKNGLL